MTWLIVSSFFFMHSAACFESSFKDERVALDYNQNGLSYADSLLNGAEEGKIIIQLIVARKRDESLIIKTNSSACAPSGKPHRNHDSDEPEDASGSSNLLPKIDSLSKIVNGIDTLFKNSVVRGSDGKSRIIFRLDNFNGSAEALTDTKDELYDLRVDIRALSKKVDAYGVICILLLLIIIGMIGYLIYTQKKIDKKDVKDLGQSVSSGYTNGRTHRHGNSNVDCDCNLHY